MTIYLYKKTHNKTGLQYLGKTIKDPHKYKGSGTRWVNHVNKHGHDVTTEILRECSTDAEVKEWGLYYSNLWEVVDNSDWANLKPESGDGGFITRQWGNPVYKERMRVLLVAAQSRIDHVAKSDAIKRAMATPEIKQRHKTSCQLAQANPAVIENNRIKQKELWKDPDIRKRRIASMASGSSHPGYDHTLYTFIHKSGITETCTRNSLLQKYNLHNGALSWLLLGKVKTHKGWRLD